MKHRTFRTICILAVLIAAYTTAMQVGPDGVRYASWTKVAIDGNIQELSGGDRLSPMSVPFFQWNAGPGLMMVPFYVMFESAKFVHLTGTEFAGRFYGLAFWLLFFLGLGHIRPARGSGQKDHDRPSSLRLAMLGVSIAFVATPLGFYSINASSECFSLMPASVLLWQTIRLSRNQTVNWWLVAPATGLLMMIRPYLGVFAWPVLLVGVWTELQGRDWKRSALAISFTGTCIMLAALQIGCTQYWMTGSPLHSPYSFGDESFRSLQLTNPPYVWQVLLDTFHGILPTHPLVGVGVLLMPALAGIAFHQQRYRVAAIWALAFVAVLINVWFQSAWYYTCMCWISFGMRGLILPSIPATVALLVALRESKRCRQVLLPVIAVCVLWSFLRLQLGPRNDMNWADLIHGQLQSIRETLGGWEIWIFIACVTVLSLACRPRRLVSMLTVATASLGLVYLFRQSMRHETITYTLLLMPVIAAILFVLRSHRRHAFRVAWIAPICFVMCLTVFARLAFTTIPRIKPNTENAMVFQEGDVRSYYKYLCKQDRGDFVRKREQLEAFFIRSGRSDWLSTSSDGGRAGSLYRPET